MSASSRARRIRLWPRTLALRLFAIFAVGLVAANALSFSLLFVERGRSSELMMLGSLESDVKTAIAILDRLPAEERGAWLERLERRSYRYFLDRGVASPQAQSNVADAVRDALSRELDTRYGLSVNAVEDGRPHAQAHVTLSDGSPLTVDITPSAMPLADWLPVVLGAQLALLVCCAWFAVRLAIRPLAHLAQAADAMAPDKQSSRLSESGPSEVAHAASAFNAMQDRIAAHLRERAQMLAAISHDLKTPITRMKLRGELMEESPQKEKLAQDLAEIERLVLEGIDYAQSAHGAVEKPQRIDPDAFLGSLVYDYQDSGQAVALSGSVRLPLVTRPHALRRILTNLIDNAVKFSGAAEICLESEPGGGVSITVTDTGPGIPPDELEAVLQPFYRLESSRNRTTGGTGLGLAIASQLGQAIGASLTLANRPSGGLSARLLLPSKVAS